MPKKSRKSPRKGKKILKTFDNNEVLAWVSTFFVIFILLILSTMSETTDLKNHPGKVACSNLAIEHLKFHRNKEKTSALCYKNNKELKEVGSFFLVWW
jgi:hypothetical protein